VKDEVSVSVDRDFARFGSKSYAINKINSVEVRRRHPYGQGLMFLSGLLTIIFFLSALGGGGAGAVVLAVLFGALAIWAWRRSQILEYQLFLMTSSSEAQAITSCDRDMIDGLRSRMERAMAGQLA
jgi:Family of unknown function (DUF6232)